MLPRTVVLTLHRASESLGGLVKITMLGFYPRESNSIGWGRGPRICIFSKFPGDPNAAGPGTILWELS